MDRPTSGSTDVSTSQYNILPRENTNNEYSPPGSVEPNVQPEQSPLPIPTTLPESTPVPEPPTANEAKPEKKKFSEKFKGIFGRKKKPEPEPFQPIVEPTDENISEGEKSDKEDEDEKVDTENKDRDYGDIPVIEDDNEIEESRPEPSAVPISPVRSDSPEDDDFQMRNVNETKSEFYEDPSDGVLIATHKNEEQAQSEAPSKKSSRFKEKFVDFMKYSVKQTLLVGMVLGYAVAGAYLFALLEVHTEQKSCQESKGADIANVVTTKAKLIEYIQFNVTSNVLDTTRDNESYAITRIEEMLTEYRDEVLNIGYSGEDCTDTKWVLINGILFCLTVVTTIGYGQVFPKTWEGQIVCICYATIGIPLFVMCLANISSVLGFLFRWMYVKVCCGICNYRKKKQQESESHKNFTTNSQLAETRAPSRVTSANPSEFDNAEARIVDDNEDLENEINDKDDIEGVSVPLTITILVVTGYILSGAVLFHFTDGFGLIESAYFCFVTLTTIGFGDLVPGQDFEDPLGPYKLAAGCAYILVGLAVLGMAFDLMQEELISKFSWFGKKIGLLDPDEDEESDEEKENGKEKDTGDEIKMKNRDLNSDKKESVEHGEKMETVSEKREY